MAGLLSYYCAMSKETFNKEIKPKHKSKLKLETIQPKHVKTNIIKDKRKEFLPASKLCQLPINWEKIPKIIWTTIACDNIHNQTHSLEKKKKKKKKILC